MEADRPRLTDPQRELARKLLASVETRAGLLAELYAPWHARWIPRERNAECDALTKRRPTRAED